MIRNLSYVGIASPRADQWRSFGPDVLGASLAPDADDGAVRLRVDEHTWRIAIHPAEVDDLRYLGWDIGDDANLAATVDRVHAAGLSTHDGDTALLAAREVDSLTWFVDPFGNRHELVHGLRTGTPFEPGRDMSGSFRTGAQGLGHVVLFVPDGDEAERFATEVLGLVVSDYIEMGATLRFLHCAGHEARHHSLALVPVPGMAGLHHLMLEVTDIDDVGRARDLALEAGLIMSMDLGRHPNDLMSSFYVRTPSGFEIEYGTGGALIDDDTWSVSTYDQASTWGHHPPPDGAPASAIMRPVDAAAG